ncbi:MAG: sugar transferase [Pseudolabrys sp.]
MQRNKAEDLGRKSSVSIGLHRRESPPSQFNSLWHRTIKRKLTESSTMRMRSPASRSSFRLRFSVFDVVWAAASPVLATFFFDATLYSPERINATIAYCLISFGLSLCTFLLFRIRDGMADYFSVHDALDVAKAVVVAELLTILVLFTTTRLDNVPRSIPIIHALILAAGLVLARTFVRVMKTELRAVAQKSSVATENIIMIGSTNLSSLYMKMVEAYSPRTKQVIAILDDDQQLTGRSVAGARIMGPALQLEPVIQEFTEHGIHVDQVVVGGDPDMLSTEQLDQLDRVCTQYEIRLDFVPMLVGLSKPKDEQPGVRTKILQPPASSEVSRFFRVKRIIDLAAGLVLLVLLLPVFFVVGGLVLLDVGSPVFFWQQRLGLMGRKFLLHKFRTLKTSYDWRGQPIPDSERISWIGNLLRKCRLDELPQLLNVLVGDMSLIGPRPLLPRDQPPDPSLRLMVRPGITGWAQVNGGKLLTSAEKNELDEWYIRNASLRLDLWILAKTIVVIFRGERRRGTPSNNNGTADKTKFDSASKSHTT